MLASVIVASVVIFLLMLVWVFVDRLYRADLSNGIDACELPRHECCHCTMVDSCRVQADHFADPIKH